ncbi:tRNA methyltransferase complex subunit Cpd1 [Melanogaster broomeanus]|nr:tRNA methyltransferase complex subunit Cpd1 [Melanogaster broomeanus]
MWSTNREVAAGDVVIIWQTREHIQPLLVTPGKDFNSRFGFYRHADFVGIPYGSKVGSRNGKGFIHVLRPTPELWTMALPHRTQILRGSRVIEAGTGSGSFSHSVARTIGSTGHLYSYEFHEARADKAREEFIRHGMEDIVTLTHRNVCKDGFTVENVVDSVFLDLPAPWDAVEHAKKALRKDCPTRICCFSPCMEQVLRTVSALNDAGFTDCKFEQEESERTTWKAQSPIREPGRRNPVLSRTTATKMDQNFRPPVPESVKLGAVTGSSQVEVTPAKVNLSKISPEVRGHTSYLTFARLVPLQDPTAESSQGNAAPVSS